MKKKEDIEEDHEDDANNGREEEHYEEEEYVESDRKNKNQNEDIELDLNGKVKSGCFRKYKCLVALIRDEGEYLSHTRKQCRNLGPLVRCSVAFGVYKLITIPYFTFDIRGSFGSDKYLRRNNFHDWNSLRKYATKHKYKIVGVCQKAMVNVFVRQQEGKTNQKGEKEYQDEGKGKEKGTQEVEREQEKQQQNWTSRSISTTSSPKSSTSSTNLLANLSTTSSSSRGISGFSLGEKIQNSKETGTSIPIQERPFVGSTIFVYNYHPFLTTVNSQNRSEKIVCHCDYYIHIEGASNLYDRIHGNADGIPSTLCPDTGKTFIYLSPDILISIALQQFTSWAEYKPTAIKGFKYEKKILPKVRRRPSLMEHDDEEKENGPQELEHDGIKTNLPCYTAESSEENTMEIIGLGDDKSVIQSTDDEEDLDENDQFSRLRRRKNKKLRDKEGDAESGTEEANLSYLGFVNQASLDNCDY